MTLDRQDLSFSVLRLPASLKEIMKSEQWQGNIFVGGGYIRSIIAREKINDIDVFVKSKEEAELLAYKLAKSKDDIYKTDNAYTIHGRTVMQIIHRWVFPKPEDVSDSFDFTICCAVIYCTSKPMNNQLPGEKPKFIYTWDSFCDDRFYLDLAAKRLVYRNPIRNEDVGGSMLRVLKYYQNGYRIPLDSLGNVVARLISTINTMTQPLSDQAGVGRIITGLLRVVDPAIDPLHEAHLPAQDETLRQDNMQEETIEPSTQNPQ